MNEDTKFLIDLVMKASNLITDEIEVKTKDDKGDLVTNFDYEIETFINNEIKKNYPDFDIVSEEFNSDNKLTTNCFTVDPIDGTVNFANNIPLWGIQVACIRNNETTSAVIYLPKLNELYYADETGSYMNGVKIKVNSLEPKKGLYSIEGNDRLLAQAKMNSLSINCRDFWCAALTFAWVASGRLSATTFKKDSPWDYIPGEFIVKQAGGFISNDTNSHMAANSKEFIEILKENTIYNKNEKVVIVKDNQGN